MAKPLRSSRVCSSWHVCCGNTPLQVHVACVHVPETLPLCHPLLPSPAAAAAVACCHPLLLLLSCSGTVDEVQEIVTKARMWRWKPYGEVTLRFTQDANVSVCAECMGGEDDLWSNSLVTWCLQHSIP
jgi:hypothetical protein